MDLIEKFKSKFTEGDKESCWDWEFGVTAGGYGQMAYKCKKYASHRLSWSYYNDKSIPKGCVIMHTCDNPKCVNPSHLKLGTQKDNVADMMAKGRFKDYNKKGSNNPQSVVNPDHVIDIYTSNGTHKAISEKYGYKLSTVANIRIGRGWTHITNNLVKGSRGKAGAKGELNGKCTLTEDIVKEIYEREGSAKELARFFLCSYNAIYGIKSGATWSHVTNGLTKG